MAAMDEEETLRLVASKAGGGGNSGEGLEILARETFALQGDTHRLVTFLNQALKDKGFIFGLSRSSDGGSLQLTIYVVPPSS